MKRAEACTHYRRQHEESRSMHTLQEAARKEQKHAHTTGGSMKRAEACTHYRRQHEKSRSMHTLQEAA